MRKKSILMVCISALIALTMFVGCDNAPVLPSFVVGGNVTQTGDFLTGQNFDPSKFSVSVTYDNGKIVAADDTVSVMIVGDETVEAGDTAIVDFGIDYKGNHVTKEVAISVYDVQTLSVEGPATYVEDSEISKNDLKVTATYYANEDGVQTEKTMILTPAEYAIISGYKYVANEPSVDNPEVEAYVEISALGATGRFNFTATFDDSSLILANQIKAITAVTAKASAAPYAWDYGYDPQPSFDDVTIMALVGDATQSTTIPEDLGFTLTYVDDSTGLPIDGSDYSAVKKVRVRAEINGSAKESAAIDVKPVTVTLSKAENAELPELIKGAALPAVDKADFIVTYTVDGISNYADMENVEFLYSTLSNGVIAPANGVVPASGNLYIYAKYNGVTSASIDLGTAEDAPAIEEIKSIELVDGFTLVKQIYEELPEALSAVESITVVMDDDSETVISSDALEENATVTFTSDTAGNTPLTTNLTSATSAYAKVIVGSVAKVVPVTLVDAVVDELVVTLAYSDEDMTAPLLEATMTITPELTTTTGGTLSTTGVMYIDTETGHYSTLSSPVTIDANEHTYKAAIWVGDELVESEEFTIPAGIGYVNVEEANISTSITVAKAGTYLALIDDPISDDPDDYVVTVENAATVVKGDAKVTITSIEFPADQKVQDSGNKVWANISYVGPTGETITGRVEVSPFTGTAYVEVLSSGLRVMYEDPETGEKSEITQFNRAETYVVENLSVEGFINHEATAPTVAITNEWNGDAASGTNLELQGSSMKFTITFTGFNAEENKVESGMTASVTIPVVG